MKYYNSKQIFNLFEKKECSFCGSKEDLEVHHKDMDRLNNNFDNIILLCRKHHRELHQLNKSEEKIEAICKKCNYKWLYAGSSRIYVTCPRCKANTKLPQNIDVIKSKNLEEDYNNEQ